MGRTFSQAARRWERIAAKRLIEWLVRRYHWHNSVLNTNLPNVACLCCVSITVCNQYGQLHSHNFGPDGTEI